MRFRYCIFIGIVFVFMQSCSLLRIESAQEPLTKRQLNSRLLTQQFVADATDRVEEAADSIITSEANLEIERNAYLWKLKTLTAYRKVGFQTMPQLALLDSWEISLAIENFMATQKAASMFGSWQNYVQIISKENLLEIERYARGLLEEDEYEAYKELVYAFAEENPIDEFTFTHTSLREAYLEAQNIADSNAVQTVGSLSEVMNNFSNRLVYTSESTGKQLQWNAELMLKEQGVDSASLKAAFDNMDRSLDRLVTTAETTPELLDQSVKDFRADMYVLFRGLHRDMESSKEFITMERLAMDTIIERERIALDSFILRERKALTAEVNLLAEDVVDNTMDHVKGLLTRVLLLSILFFAIILFLPFAIGYYTGKIRQRNRHLKRKKQG
ncbi:hypothetical protein [Galbibacter mesophilus]|uniref:hypothetical protein n=1 Tax=Galbibacter mesophilus TaxID=379069 RepID=UPI00191E0F72|nr:hypothetical protein [Galbibacter mesophilus]MCM5663006.1 hypothetical protein [Galbibacter mesophilus]